MEVTLDKKIKLYVLDSLLAQINKPLTPNLINEITTEMVGRLTEVMNKEVINETGC